jgi:hypothetical protein
MQILNCTIGKWRAEAQVEEVEIDKLMAIISVTGDGGNTAGQSKHTVVFEHKQGNDTLEETREIVQRLLHARYGQ